MYALFEDAGKFLAGRILSEAEASAQIELESGKRVKAKAAHVLLRFEQPAPARLIEQATSVAQSIELDLAWEFAPDDEFGFADLAHEYFSANATSVELAAALIRLYDAPHYFRRAGKGRFKKAPAEVIQQALAAIEKKKQLQLQIDGWAQELAAGTCPAPILSQLYRILFKPDKNGPEYKAVVEAARATHTAPLALLQRAGAITSSYQFHWQRFLFEHFPKGVGFASVSTPAITDALPLATVQAYSIDDSHTTEIDDALSVQGLGSGEVTVGIHIAAPGLAITPESAVDQMGRSRLSTVYMPGHKITMLPDEVVQAYTLQEGQDCPALSLYVKFNEASLSILSSDTRLERVPIVANLRHDRLDSVVTESWLQSDAPDTRIPGDHPASALEALPHAELAFLHRLAQALKSQREQVRGKPETFNRPDYTFRLEGVGDHGPQGEERVTLGVRQRGAPLDLIVAEAMILANSTWGQWMADLGVPAIYRSQASLAPGVKVRMSTRALPHAGIGVPCYAWSTSPLRRYVDLVNQWQIIACARHGKTAALAAPFKPKDTALMAIISAFDAAYTAYNGYQASMERFWTLQHVRQQGLREIEATVFKMMPGMPPMARADHLPLVLPVLGAGGADVTRGSRVLLQLSEPDDITLDINGQLIQVLDAASAGSGASDAAVDSAFDDASDEDESAGPLSIAVDLDVQDAASASEGQRATDPAPAP
jgi:exoribonuclease-2